MADHNYFVYIMTNKNQKVYYVGVTNNLQQRVYDHANSSIPGFTKKYKCYFLLYFERHSSIKDAIHREKIIKKWRREKKEDLIDTMNPEWKTLNDEIIEL